MLFEQIQNVALFQPRLTSTENLVIIGLQAFSISHFMFVKIINHTTVDNFFVKCRIKVQLPYHLQGPLQEILSQSEL